MSVDFLPMNDAYAKDSLALYNAYVLASTATFSINPLTQEEMDHLLFSGLDRFPSYAIVVDGEFAVVVLRQNRSVQNLDYPAIPQPLHKFHGVSGFFRAVKNPGHQLDLFRRFSLGSFLGQGNGGQFVQSLSVKVEENRITLNPIHCRPWQRQLPIIAMLYYKVLVRSQLRNNADLLSITGLDLGAFR